jgi:hypothetical protein
MIFWTDLLKAGIIKTLAAGHGIDGRENKEKQL